MSYQYDLFFIFILIFNQLYNLIKTDKFVFFFQQFFKYLKLVLDDNIDEKRE